MQREREKKRKREGIDENIYIMTEFLERGIISVWKREKQRIQEKDIFFSGAYVPVGESERERERERKRERHTNTERERKLNKFIFRFEHVCM